MTFNSYYIFSAPGSVMRKKSCIKKKEYWLVFLKSCDIMPQTGLFTSFVPSDNAKKHSTNWILDKNYTFGYEIMANGKN